MDIPRENHLTFWRTLAENLAAGKCILDSLKAAKAGLEGRALEKTVGTIVSDVEGGAVFSEALATHQAMFSRSAVAMARAGEAGGVLDVASGRIAEGIDDGSIVAQGVPVSHYTVMIRYWRSFARLLSTGVPIAEVLDILSGHVAGKCLDATLSMRQAVLEDGSLAQVMRSYPSVFHADDCIAIARAEQSGTLDTTAFRIAEAIERGHRDLPSETPTQSADESMEHGEQVADQIAKALEKTQGQGTAAASASEDGDEGLAPAERFLVRLIRDAMKRRASDIHLDPLEEPPGTFGEAGRVRLRLDGVLHDVEAPPRGLFPSVVSRVRTLADMGTAETALPAVGRIMLSVDGKRLDLRVSVVPTFCGERVVMRILDRQTVILGLDQLGLTEQDLATIRELCRLPSGIIIVTGPTGCGKTTFLYSLVMEMNRDRCCVMSVEDPVEFVLPGVAQMQLNPKTGLTFPRAIVSMFRQDPDVLMIGEIRDLETVSLACQAALTGHLVLTTLHAGSAPGALKRLVDMGLPPFMVNSAVAATIAMRLVRRLCPECRKKAKPNLNMIPPEAADVIKAAGEDVFFGPGGCPTCHGGGYKGRTAIYEPLVPDEGVREAMATGAHLAAIRNAALAAGMKTLVVDGVEKAARGVTSIEEVLRVATLGPNE